MTLRERKKRIGQLIIDTVVLQEVWIYKNFFFVEEFQITFLETPGEAILRSTNMSYPRLYYVQVIL